MKKRLISVLIAVVFLMVMFAACSDDPQEVKIVGTSSSSSASNVNAVLTGDKESAILTWDAAQNAYEYDICVQQEGKKTVERASGSASNEYTYNASGVGSANLDVDKWAAKISVRYYTTGKYRFGVIANVVGGSVANSSDIKWSNYIEL
jgi:hypothetical protein